MRTVYSSHPRLRSVAARQLACLTCLFSLCLQAVQAADPDPATVAALARCRADLTADDCRLTVAAMKALAAEPRLAHLNIGLTVHDHVIALWGFVPSTDVAKLAVNRLLDVPGVGRVLNQLQVSQDQQGLQPSPPVTAPRAVPSGQPAPDGPLPSDVPGPMRDLLQAPVVAERARDRSGPPPMRVAARASLVTVDPTIAAPRPDRSIPSANERAIANMIQGNVRYLHLRAEIRGGAVSLRGQVYSWNDLQLLAGAITRLPGVQRVLLDEVHVAQ